MENGQGSSSSRKRTEVMSSVLLTPSRSSRRECKLPSRYREDDIHVQNNITRSPQRPRSPKKKSMGYVKNLISSPVKHSPARRALGPSFTEGSSSPCSQPNREASPISELIDVCGSESYDGIATSSQTGCMPSSSSATSVTRTDERVFALAKSSDLSNSTSKPTVVPTKEPLRRTKLEKERELVLEKLGLSRLQHLLSLKKARVWLTCEFFYSGMDEQLFNAENEFSQIIQESFPNLKTLQLNKPAWRAIRRLLGKPRRCSPQFFLEERQALEQKRDKIRAMYNGTFFSQRGVDYSDIPPKIPRPFVVGQRVFSRLSTNGFDGIYSGTVDAVLKNGYRVIFDQEDLIPPTEVLDTHIIPDGVVELVPISYFSDQSSSKFPFETNKTVVTKEIQHDLALPALAHNRMMRKEVDITSGDKVGNFPVRMLVILVKLSKLIDTKRRLVRQLCELNTEAEKANLLTNYYQPTFQEKYAQIVVDLEQLNKQMRIYLQGITDYNCQISSNLNESNYSRPELLRKNYTAQAEHIVGNCNNGLNVRHPKAIALISSLTSMLLQIRALGQQKLTPLDLQALSESIIGIRNQISPHNVAWFQDHVEVHMKQISNTMIQAGTIGK